MTDFPEALMPPGRVEPVPRRIRTFAGGEKVVDTTRAFYAWEIPSYPQFYIPFEDVRPGLLVAEDRHEVGPFGPVDVYSLDVGTVVRPHAARHLTQSSIPALDNTVRFHWPHLDEWYEEDERVFVHPRNPYTRVDALRSTRTVRVELEGVVLAQSSSPVMVFETGLPTRYYLNRTEVDFSHLVPTDTVTACPYKGTTSQYWSARIGDTVYPDVAWSYDFPTAALLPIAGLVAFYNEKVHIAVTVTPDS